MLLWKSLSFITEADVARHLWCVTVKLCPREHYQTKPGTPSKSTWKKLKTDYEIVLPVLSTPTAQKLSQLKDRKLTYSLSDDNGGNQVSDRFILSPSECLLGRYAQFWACKLSTHWLHWAKYGFVLTQTVGRSKLSPDVRGERRSLQATGQMSAPTPILCLPYEHTLNQSIVIGCRFPSVKSECDAIQKKDPKDPWQC